jgi:hypothetical protein
LGFKSELLGVQVSLQFKQELIKQAKTKGLTLSEYVRAILGEALDLKSFEEAVVG